MAQRVSDPFQGLDFPDEAWRQAWEDLNKWQQHGAELADEGFDPPAPHCIKRAREILLQWRALVCSPPKVIPDPNGGLVISWQNREFHIWND